MAKSIQLYSGPDGWTETFRLFRASADPKARRRGPHAKQRFICCDCGLGHDFEFTVFKKIRGRWRRVNRAYDIAFRSRRNMKSTAAVRRQNKHAMVPARTCKRRKAR